MKAWLLPTLLLSLAGWPGLRWLTQVRDHNTAQAQGEAAARRGQATEAAYYFGQAVALAGRGGPAPALLLNLAQAQAQAGQQATARATYSRLLAPVIPAPVGSQARQQLAVLLARQGQVAQAVELLRQALRLNPGNDAARFNYEALVQYLRGRRPQAASPPPAANNTPPPSTPRPDSTSAGGAGKQKQPAGQSGAEQPGATPPAAPSGPAGQAPAPTPDAGGQPNPQQPTSGAGTDATGGFRPGAGEERPLPSGATGGSQRGLDRRGAAAGASTGRGQQPGTEAATDADQQLQTQRERLKAMNLSPAQAQQLLDALRTSEQQYLQQRPRVRQGTAPAPGQPTW